MKEGPKNIVAEEYRGGTMSESDSHKRAKNKAAGKKGQTEVPIHASRRIDALTGDCKKATEIERSGDPDKHQMEARRLKASKAPEKVFKVPQKDMEAAAAAMRTAGVSGTIENIGGTKSHKIRAPKK
jgi:hypothetical protein